MGESREAGGHAQGVDDAEARPGEQEAKRDDEVTERGWLSVSTAPRTVDMLDATGSRSVGSATNTFGRPLACGAPAGTGFLCPGNA